MDEDLITVIESEDYNSNQSVEDTVDQVSENEKSEGSTDEKSSNWIVPTILTSTLFLIIRKLLKSKK